jgi:CubicO group peptidase (beta-lactamase class C family)
MALARINEKEGREMSFRKSFYFGMVCLALILPGSLIAWDNGTPPPTTPTPVESHPLGDQQELETFVDGVMTKQLEEQHIAGAVVVIVKDGEELLSKGYGYADVAKQIPVDAKSTLFRPGSVTKLFTWTAVMQLAEQGKIDLTADINLYLTDFKISATGSRPITMLDLMSHTAGFGETGAGDATYNAAELTSLSVYLTRYMPALVYPPGQIPAYSNYGVTLAGHIVEQVSGEPYDQYIEEHILKPLGMTHSSMRQPLPADLAAAISQSYTFNGEFQNLPFLFLQVSPAGSLSASGADIGKFMLAHLQGGEYNGGRILQPETVRLMHSQSYTFDPALTGIAHGFAEWMINGRRLIGHGGHIPEFITELRLIPAEGVGIYVCYNSFIFSEEQRTLLVDKFMDRYFPEISETQPVTALTDSDLTAYTGFYVTSRAISINTPERFFALSDMRLVRSEDNHTLLFPDILLRPLSPFQPDRWAEVRPQIFQNERGGMMVFKKDEAGQVRYLAFSNNSYMIYIKQPWYGGQDIHLGILIFSLITFLLTPIAALIGWGISLFKKDYNKRSSRRESWARGLALALCLAFLAFVAIFVQNLYTPDQPAIRILAWVIAVLAIGVTLLDITAWRQRWWKLMGRIHYTVLALAGLTFTWFLTYWSLLLLPY